MKIYTIFGIRRFILLFDKRKCLSRPELATCVRWSTARLRFHLINTRFVGRRISSQLLARANLYPIYYLFGHGHFTATPTGHYLWARRIPESEPLEAKSNRNDSIGKCQLIIIIVCECRVTDKCARLYRNRNQANWRRRKREEKKRKKKNAEKNRWDAIEAKHFTAMKRKKRQTKTSWTFVFVVGFRWAHRYAPITHKHQHHHMVSVSASVYLMMKIASDSRQICVSVTNSNAVRWYSGEVGIYLVLYRRTPKPYVRIIIL